MAYNGQKLIKLVANKTAPATSSTIPKVPVTTSVKNNTATTTANNILIILSILPTFFFIILDLKVNYNGRLRIFTRK